MQKRARRPNRKIYVATLPNGKKERIRAHTAEQVAKHFGIKTTAVILERSTQNRTGARPNHANIKLAIEQLGIKFPVDIRVIAHKSGTKGLCGHASVFGDSGPPLFRHNVRVKDWLSPEEMGEVLWHELTHCMQFEREVIKDKNPYTAKIALKNWKKLYWNGVSYQNKRHEIEANNNKVHNKTLPLAR